MRLLTAALALALVATPTGLAAVWLPATPAGDALLRAVDFATPLHGFSVGAQGTILRTVDGGVLWDLALKGSFGRSWYDVEMASPVEAWVVGASYLGGSRPAMAYTNDAGLTWKQRVFHVAAHGERHGGALRAAALAEGKVLAAAELDSGEGAVVESADGGLTWRTLLVTPEALLSLDAGAGVVVAVGGAGAAWASGDGGATWRRGLLPPELARAVLRSVDVVDGAPSTAWAAGDGGVVLRSADGGLTWERAGLPVAADLLGAAFATPQMGFVVGRRAMVFRTGDGGLTWTPEFAGSLTDFHGVAVHSTGPLVRVWVAGAEGALRGGVDLALS